MNRRRSPIPPFSQLSGSPFSGSPFPRRAARAGWLAALAALLLLLPAAARAGVVARFETKDPKRHTTEYGRLLAQDGHYRMDRLDGDQVVASVIITDGRNIIVDHAKKFWSEVDTLALKQMQEELQMAAAAFDQKVAQMPPEQRDLMVQQLSGPLPEAAAREIEKTDEQADQSGFPSRRYRILASGTLVREIWATPWDKVPGAAEIQAAQSAMEAYYQRLTAVFAGVKSQVLGVPLYNSPENPFADFGKIDGFAVLTRNFADGRSLAETVLLEVKEEKLAANAFAIPEGFTQKAMNQ